MLWLSYYSNTTTSEDDEHMKEHLKTPHARHCFDYLRQSIMCAADSNLEPVNAELGGVTGWGSERVCRDWTELRKWAGRWKSGTNVGIL